MPIIEITNFSAGIQASSGYTRAKDIAAEEMRNCIIDRQGRLARRNGSTRPLVTSELGGLVNCLWRLVYYPGYYSGLRRIIIISDTSTAPVKRWNGTTAWTNLNTTTYQLTADEMFAQGIVFD